MTRPNRKPAFGTEGSHQNEFVAAQKIGLAGTFDRQTLKSIDVQQLRILSIRKSSMQMV